MRRPISRRLTASTSARYVTIATTRNMKYTGGSGTNPSAGASRSRCPHGEDWAVCQEDHPLGDAPEQQPLHPCPSVRADDDEIGPALSGGLHDLLRGPAFHHHATHAHLGLLGAR